MDGDTARQIIRDQDRIVRDRVRSVLIEQGRQARPLVDALKPWLNRAWKQERRDRYPNRNLSFPPLGNPTPGAYREYRAVDVWAVEARVQRRELANNLGRASGLCDEVDFVDHRILRLPSEFGGIERDGLHRHFFHMWQAATELTEVLQRGAVNESLLNIPPEMHPSRHGRLSDGVLARNLINDLADQIEAGRHVDVALESGVGESLIGMQAWMQSASGTLGGLVGGAVLGSLTNGAVACESDLVADGRLLGRAYVALGLNYLMEVQDRMPDYAEASGQAPQQPHVSMTIRGGTFYGGQFAGQIAIIDSTISSIIQQGNSEVADALKAIERAVLTQSDLDDDRRRDLLDNVGYLAEAAQEPPGKRKRGIIKSALAALATAATSGAEMEKAMKAWGEVLHRMFS